MPAATRRFTSISRSTRRRMRTTSPGWSWRTPTRVCCRRRFSWTAELAARLAGDGLGDAQLADGEHEHAPALEGLLVEGLEVLPRGDHPQPGQVGREAHLHAPLGAEH